MASTDLPRLWKLHEIDAGIREIQARASSFQPGKEFAEALKKLEAMDADSGGKYRALHAEQVDLELKIKSNQDKIAKIESDLFGGKVVNVREVEAYQTEIKMLRKHNEDFEARLLEIMEQVPPLKDATDKIAAQMTIAKRKLAEAKQSTLGERKEMEERYGRLVKARPEAAKLVPPALLAKYETIRKGVGTGMAELKGMSCGGCGMALPERTLVAVREDRVTTCEGCRRILYTPVPEV